MEKVDVVHLTNEDRAKFYTEWQKSGMKQEEFCKQQGLNPKTFKNWYRFAHPYPSTGKPKVEATKKKAAAKVTKTPTTKITADGAVTKEPGLVPGETEGYIIQLKNNRTIVVPGNFDEPSLKRLIKTLEATG
jgi:hypothetical protein